MTWRDSSLEALCAIARLPSEVLADRLTVEKLKVLARAVRVSGSHPKLETARLITERAMLIERMSIIGTDPAEVARTFKRESLKTYARELGCFTGLNKYGLACSVIGRRDQILKSINAELLAPA